MLCVLNNASVAQTLTVCTSVVPPLLAARPASVSSLAAAVPDTARTR